jgi:hypothetical protein
MVFVPTIVMSVIMTIPVIMIMAIVVAVGMVIARAVVGTIDPASRYPDSTCIIPRCPDISRPRAWRSSIGRICDHGRADLHGNTYLSLRTRSGKKDSSSQDECTYDSFHVFTSSRLDLIRRFYYTKNKRKMRKDVAVNSWCIRGKIFAMTCNLSAY